MGYAMHSTTPQAFDGMGLGLYTRPILDGFNDSLEWENKMRQHQLLREQERAQKWMLPYAANSAASGYLRNYWENNAQIPDHYMQWDRRNSVMRAGIDGVNNKMPQTTLGNPLSNDFYTNQMNKPGQTNIQNNNYDPSLNKIFPTITEIPLNNGNSNNLAMSPLNNGAMTPYYSTSPLSGKTYGGENQYTSVPPVQNPVAQVPLNNMQSMPYYPPQKSMTKPYYNSSNQNNFNNSRFNPNNMNSFSGINNNNLFSDNYKGYWR